jgi:cytochrome c-type biogenesis protein CcmH/NrfG
MSPDRFELPENLSPEEERALIQALERYFEEQDTRPDPWAMAGRLEATREGTFQARRALRNPWRTAGRGAFARPGTQPISGRGDSA